FLSVHQHDIDFGRLKYLKQLLFPGKFILKSGELLMLDRYILLHQCDLLIALFDGLLEQHRIISQSCHNHQQCKRDGKSDLRITETNARCELCKQAFLLLRSNLSDCTENFSFHGRRWLLSDSTNRKMECCLL